MTMRIEHFALTNFKGLTDTIPLGRKTIFFGDNGSGKTARLQALTFAITGETSLGAKPEATAQLGGHKGCTIAVTLDDGFAWARSIVKKVKEKTVHMGLAVVGQESMGVTKADPVVAAHCGRFAPMFNLATFLDLSDDKRRDYVLDLCSRARGGEAVDVDDIVARIRLAVIDGEIGEGTVAMAAKRWHRQPLTLPTLAATLLDELPLAFRIALDNVLGQVSDDIAGDLTVAIAAALDTAKSLANASKRTHDQAVQAARKLSEQKALVSVVADSEEKLREQYAEYVAQREALIAQASHQEGRESALQSIRLDIARLGVEIEQAQKTLAELNVPRDQTLDDAEAIEREADELGKELLIEPVDETVELQRAVDDARKERDLADVADREALAAVENIQQQQGRIQDAIKDAESSDWVTAMRLASGVIDELEERPTIIDYLSDSESWRMLTELLRSKANTDGIATLRDDLTAVTDKREAATFARGSTGSRVANALNEFDLATKDLEAAERRRQDTLRQRNEQQKRIGDLRQQAANIRVDLETRQGRIDAWRQTIVDKVAAQLEAEQRLNGLIADTGDIPEQQLRDQAEAVKAQMEQVTADIKTKQQAATLDAELAKCVASAEAEEVYHDVCKAVVAAIKTLRESLMQELVAPLIERVNRFLSVAAPGCKAYCNLVNDKGKPVFELGWTVDGRVRRTYPALSGGEQAVFGAGLAYALVMLADPPLKLLLLEAGAIDTESMRHVIAGLDAIADDVGNVIVATHHPPWITDDSGWNCVELRRVEAAAEVAV